MIGQYIPSDVSADHHRKPEQYSDLRPLSLRTFALPTSQLRLYALYALLTRHRYQTRCSGECSEGVSVPVYSGTK